MNWFVGSAPALNRTLLILIGRTFRTLWVVVSICFPRAVGIVHSALPVRKPAPAAPAETTLKAALTLAPGPTGPAIARGAPAVQPAGTEMLSLTPAAADPVVLENVIVTSCDDPGVNVLTRDTLTRCTSHLAATILACTASVVASVGYPVVITPS